jgi:hypothetical protein
MGPNDRCGVLDVGDNCGYIPTGEIRNCEVAAAMTAAVSSPVFDGNAQGPVCGRRLLEGTHTVAKAQNREHTQLSDAYWFERVRTSLRLPAPELLDAGTISTKSGPRWWLVLTRMPGDHDGIPTAARQHILGMWMRRWHDSAPPGRLRLDDPGALGVLLGTPRKYLPTDAYIQAAGQLAEICVGMPMTAVHGDLAVCLNSLWFGETTAILDPGSVNIAPPMIDLAWCLAADLPHGAALDPLLEGYGRDAVDLDALDALLPHFLLRRLVDVLINGDRNDIDWLSSELRRRAPGLLSLANAGASSD